VPNPEPDADPPVRGRAAGPLTDRLFFALRPEGAALARCSALAADLSRSHGLRGRPLAPARMHVTLAFLGDHAGLPPALLDEARRAGAAAAAAVPPFQVAFDRVDSFGRAGRRPLVLLGAHEEGREDGLSALRRALRAGLADQPRRRDVEPFRPHLTLLYDERAVAEPLAEPIAWRVAGFELVHSTIGRQRHEVLARWALAG